MSSVAHKIDSHESLSGLVLTEERIFAVKIPVEEVCVLELPEISYGPLWIRDLKKVLDRFPEIYDHARLRKFGSEQSMELWEHPYFGRRKPTLVPRIPENPLEDALILVRKGGAELGPYPYNELLSMVEKGELALTDPYSTDSGKTWDRLHNIQVLNRRQKLNAERLPKSIPIMAKEPPIQIQFVQMKSLDARPSGLFRGMADSGFLNAAKIAATNVLFPLPRLVISKMSEHLTGPIGQILDTKTKKIVTGIILAVAGFMILTFALVKIFTPAPQISQDENTIESISENLNGNENAPKTQVNRSISSQKSKIDAHKTARPPVINTSQKSFTKSKAYQEATKQNSDSDGNNETYDQPESGPYDQQEDPVQQDEVRRKLGRETIAPEDDTTANLPPAVDEEGHEIIQAGNPEEMAVEVQE